MPQIEPAFHLLETVNALKRLPRSGWLFAGIAQPESVAEHTCIVAFLTLALGESINQKWQEQGIDRPLDLARAAQIALLHDVAESLVTDLPKRSATLLNGAAGGTDLKHAAEATAMTQIFAALPNGANYVALWHEYSDALSPEARLVKDVDKLEMIHQALQYERAGNRNLDEFWQQPKLHYPASKAFYQVLCRQRQSFQIL